MRSAWNRYHRPKLLVLDNHGVLLRARHDRGLDPIALIVRLTAGEYLAAGLRPRCVVEDPLDDVKLHLVRDGPKDCRNRDAVAGKGALVVCLGLGDELVDKGVVDVGVHVDPLGGRAELASVEEATRARLGHDLVEVDVGAHKGGVVAAEL
ncbi:hypothetical protein PoMZ_07890 [Pyricularia oryzae]|uniref:Uncharacterized protein n=1 Tax=Pyricularia oryzae TaxID=318829 RepID=A0A4P7NGH9_PYROR|nr:hypothetical protein PoMZ_07890 [Pyricularia oryzae]